MTIKTGWQDLMRGLCVGLIWLIYKSFTLGVDNTRIRFERKRAEPEAAD